MKKNGKKILISLAATMLLSTSVGQTAKVNYRNNNSQCNRKGYVINCKNYSNDYLKNKYNNIIIRLTPKNWDNNNNNDNIDVPIKPEKPENPVEDNK